MLNQSAERARELVMAHGWNTTCYQILNPGIELWFSGRGDAVIGFVRRGRVCVVAGAPVCAEDRLPKVLEEWHRYLDRMRFRVAYFGAEQRLHKQLAGDSEFSVVTMGSQPVWTPASFASAIQSDRRLRYQLHRARNKSVTVEEWPSNRANSPNLWGIIHHWLEHRGLPPMHFLVESNTLGNLGDRRLFVALRGGQPVCLVVMTPIPDRKGWLTEQFPRGQGAPNGSVELTLSEAVRAIGETDAQFVTMGIVPLSRRADDTVGNPSWLNQLLNWARAHGRKYYDFDGLDHFKAKLHPDEWEPIYVISRERRFSFRTLWAIAAAFSDGPVLSTLLRATVRRMLRR